MGVARIGATVHRPATPNSVFVRSLLLHLERSAFAGAPRHLGMDEDNRDIFSYLPGDVPSELEDHPDHVLESAARLIRSFHDATAPLIQSGAATRSGIEVVCHNDLSPCNTVFRNGLPAALIDFDAACPGTRSFDLGYAAWLWLDWGNPDWSGADQLRRLRLFLAAYGRGPAESEVIESALLRQSIVIAAGERTAEERMTAWAMACHQWTLCNLRHSGARGI